jgi:hypothetical protein
VLQEERPEHSTEARANSMARARERGGTHHAASAHPLRNASAAICDYGTDLESFPMRRRQWSPLRRGSRHTGPVESGNFPDCWRLMRYCKWHNAVLA